jgi:hypothetical protein
LIDPTDGIDPNAPDDPDCNAIGEQYKSITDTVTYDIETTTGYGARLKPRLIPRPIEPQGEIKQVIDCIE